MIVTNTTAGLLFDTAFGPVLVADHKGRDCDWANPRKPTVKDRGRMDNYLVQYNGRTYSAYAGAVWDRIENNEWVLERVSRKTVRTYNKGTTWAAAKATWTTLKRNEKAYKAIAEALAEHAKLGGYAARPQ